MITECIHIVCFSAVFSPVCIAIHVIFCWEGMFGYESGNFIEALLPSWIAMPLFTCPTCMASIWGSLFWFLTGGGLSIWWIVACFSLCGINSIASSLLYNCQDKDEL